MIPHDLPSRTLRLPKTDDHGIVVLTGTSFRHLRFAYRIQQEFGDTVLAWYQVADSPNATGPSSRKRRAAALYRKVRDRILPPQRLEDLRKLVREEGRWEVLKRGWSARREFLDALLTLYWLYRRRRSRAAFEKRMFALEIERLKAHATVQPRLVKDPNAEEFIAGVRTLNAYFLLTLGGPLYTKALLKSVRGVAINQHAGWSPVLKGSCTTEWGLYSRSLDRVGSTVHILTSGADAGPILRRSHPCLTEEDTPDMCFFRVVALGTELMIECVRKIIARKEITVCDPPAGGGRTYLTSQLSGDVLRSIHRDFADGWLARELARMRDF